MLNRKVGIGLAIGLFMGIIIGVAGLSLMNRVQPAPLIIQAPSATVTPVPTNTPGPIRVFVNGQVVSAAVYELPTNSIVDAAIQAAGGFTDEANTAVVNLAQPLQDGMQIYVPATDETADQPVVVINNTADNTVAPTGNTAVGSPSSGLIDLNTATLQELDTLPGVGPSTAQSIIDHRDENGPFAAIENVMDVSGIGEAKFAQMKDLITVNGE